MAACNGLRTGYIQFDKVYYRTSTILDFDGKKLSMIFTNLLGKRFIGV